METEKEQETEQEREERIEKEQRMKDNNFTCKEKDCTFYGDVCNFCQVCGRNGVDLTEFEDDLDGELI